MRSVGFWFQKLGWVGLLVLISACSPVPGQGMGGSPQPAGTEAAPASPTLTPTLFRPEVDQEAVRTRIPPTRASPTAAPETPVQPEEEIMKIIILVDNHPYRKGMETSWGFSALVAFRESLILFDTGGDGALLLRNMERMGVDPASIQAVVLSHPHRDHTGGLSSLLGAGSRPVVYIPPSFPRSWEEQIGSQTKLVRTQPGDQIGERIFTTGEIPGAPPEQALILDLPQGVGVITGCAHPGVVEMVREAKRQLHEPPFLVLGGFHLHQAGDRQILNAVRGLQRLGVELVGPGHCSGERARALFSERFQEGYLELGAGRIIELEVR